MLSGLLESKVSEFYDRWEDITRYEITRCLAEALRVKCYAEAQRL